MNPLLSTRLVKVDVENTDGTITRDVEVTPHVKFLIDKDKNEAVAQRSAEWYDKRRRYITASAVASIIGHCAFENRISVLKKKLKIDDDEIDSFGNRAKEYGTRMEPYAIRKYEEKVGLKVIPLGLLESVNEGEQCFAGSPDGILQSGKLIEIKCPFSRIPTEEIPHHYIPQVQFLMNILNVETCDFVQYAAPTFYADEKLFITTINRDRAWFENVKPILFAFWADVERLRQVPRELLTLPNDDERLDPALREKPKKKRAPRTPKIVEEQREKISDEDLFFLHKEYEERQHAMKKSIYEELFSERKGVCFFDDEDLEYYSKS